MRNLVFVIGLCLPALLLAQEQKSYAFTLDEARNYALENNQIVKNANLDIEAAKKVVWETTAIGLPQVNASYNFQYIPGDIPTIQFDPNMPPIELGVSQSATYDVTVSQLVFSGEYIVGLQASRTFLQLSQNAKEKSELDIKEIISSSYFSILVLENNKITLDSSVLNLEKLVNETKAYVQTGFREETDLEQMQITMNTVKNSQKTIERQIEISYKLFKIQLGLGINDEVKLTQNLNDHLSDIENEMLLNNEFNIKENVEYKMLETQEKISELNLKRQKSLFLPTVSAFYLYQDKTNKADFDITFNNIIGVSVNVPIFSSGQKLSRVSQAKIDLEKSMNLKEQSSEMILMNVDQSGYDFKNAYDKFQTEKSNLELTKKIYDKTVIKYNAGVSSGMDVTQANNQYLTNNSSYIMAVLNMLNSKVKLEKAINNL